jgi:hypothetical protein
MARTRRRLTETPAAAAGAPEAKAPAVKPVALPTLALEKARAAADRLRDHQLDMAGARRLAHDAEVREALVRTELTVALHESLSARAGLEAAARERAIAAYRAMRRSTTRRAGRLSRLIDRILARLGSLGQAAVIARSGVWRGTGRPLHDLRHMAAYARRGANPAVAPLAPVDQAWYLAANADVAAGRTAPLVHYLVAGGREGRAPNGLFDPEWYAREHRFDLSATGVTPLEHFVRTGAGGDGASHPLFDVGHYLAQAPLLAADDDPLSHYLREGWALGFSPHPLFDTAWYVRQAPEAASEPALVHYLTTGWRDGLSPHPLFDGRWYRREYPEIVASGVEPLTHFLAEGGGQGLNPSPWFDTRHYIEARGDDLALGVNPLVDYLRGGAWAVAEARPGFPTAAYLARWPELARAGVTPLEHWARQGGP